MFTASVETVGRHYIPTVTEIPRAEELKILTLYLRITFSIGEYGLWDCQCNRIIELALQFEGTLSISPLSTGLAKLVYIYIYIYTHVITNLKDKNESD